MRLVLVIAMLCALPTVVSADNTSFSGHWQDASGRRLFLHHRPNGTVSVWVATASRQVAFENGKLTLLSEADNMTGTAALYELEAVSKETLLIRSGGMSCQVVRPRLSLLGLMFRSGWRGRNMEFRAVGHLNGTMVCGDAKSSWAVSYSGSWKRL